MHVKTSKITINLFSSYSLKDKRSVLKSIIHKIHNQFNVSIAEVDSYDVLNQGTLGLTTVSNNKTFNDQTFNKIYYFIENYYEVEIVYIEDSLF